MMREERTKGLPGCGFRVQSVMQSAKRVFHILRLVFGVSRLAPLNSQPATRNIALALRLSQPATRNSKLTSNIPQLVTRNSQCAFLLALLFIPTLAFSQEFTATALGDYGNVTVMEVSGNYDAENPDGGVNAVPRQAIAKEFFKTHKDEYDFLVIFSNFAFQMPDDAKAKAFYEGVKNDTSGIGMDPYDNTALYGSIGKLQGTVDMGNLAQLATDPLHPDYENTLYILSHELMHRWGARVKFRNLDGTLNTALLGKDQSHWSFLLDSGGSVMYGNSWQDNRNGTYTTQTPQSELKFYSPLDLYLMGMIDKAKVPPMLLIDSPGVDAGQLPQVGVTVTGTARTVTIDDIIAAMGPRMPDAASSQKSFKTAFILVTQPDTFMGDELYKIENIRNGFVTRHSILTDGRSIVEVASMPKDDVPVNPGITPPSTTPRTLPPNIDDGVQWLMADQRSDGSWQDMAQTTERDTALTTLVLRNFTTAQQNYQNGLLWLAGTQSVNLDYLARKIEALAGAGQDVVPLVQDMLSRQNTDGGWGSREHYASGNADTALALNALVVAGYGDASAISNAIGYLKSAQNPDGGWGSEDKGGMVRETANVLSALNSYQLSAYRAQLSDHIAKGTAWLIARQNSDGGFGNSPSTVYDTATAVLTLRELNASTDITNKALTYLLGRQSENGSWNQSAYQTSLAVGVVYNATVDPDLSVKSDDTTIIPATIKRLPSDIVINANIGNLGQTGVQARVVLYEGAVSDANKIGEQTLSFPGQSTTTVAFSALAKDGNEHLFTIVADPDNQVKESNELNNTAIKILSPEATYDFEVLPSNISVSADPANMLQDVQITAQITNKGTMNAYNVQVKYYIDDPSGPFEIATQTVDILAGATITNEFTWRANKAGVDMLLTVMADPFDSFAEISETNNQADAPLTVNADTRPNLTISYKDIVITPSPVNSGGSMTISALVGNEGSSAADDINVIFYRGVPGPDGLLLGAKTIPALAPGQSAPVAFDWTNIPESGEKIITVQVDPANVVPEIREDDNEAFTTVNIRSLPDLALPASSIMFSPAAPKEGDHVIVTVTVQNKGEQTASNVVVRLTEGSAVLGNQSIPSLAGSATATVSLAYDTAAKKGTHTITAFIDPDNAIAEQSKDNNSASRTLGVQDSSFWVTELYISPNGDGVKDSTELFFRLQAPAKVSIRVVNKQNETVQTFNVPELQNTMGGSILWDGLNHSGVVVDDGEYQFRILDSAGSLLAMLEVTVDNNRSPLTDAIGTKYLLNSNLTCALPTNRDWKWFPDESGILINIGTTPEYSNGIYSISPDGADVVRLTPGDWNDATNPEYQYSYGDYKMAPDGEKIAFTLDKYYKTTGLRTAELWLMDSDGTHLTLLDTIEEGQTNSIYDVMWSPQGDFIIYRTYTYKYPPGSIEALRVIRADGTGKATIDSGGYYDFNYVHWSPDGSQIVYVYGSYDAGRNYIEKIRVSDLMGIQQQVFSDILEADYTFINYLTWLNRNKLILSLYGLDGRTIWLVDPSGNNNHISVGKHHWNRYIIWPAPGGRFFAFTPEDTSDIAISDSEGNIFVQKARTGVGTCVPRVSDIVWSADGATMAFSELLEACGGCPTPCNDPYGPHVIVLDANTKQDKSFALDVTPFAWMSGDRFLFNFVSGDTSESDWSIVLLNLETGESSSSPMPGSTHFVIGDTSRLISPRERYISYYQWVDYSSACAAIENKSEDLWVSGSLLNLAADVRVVRQQSAVLLKGTATDLNFDRYTLEYADVKGPDTWHLIQPLSDILVVNDVFTAWVPPYEGTFHVRLTVWDKAGNKAVSKKRVSWGQHSSITNLYKSLEIFSPNNDGVKDTVELHYRALDPVHLELNIYDDANNLVKTYYKDHTTPTEDFIQWDGTDESFNVVPDGKYTIKVFDYEYFVEVDNTPPDVGIKFDGIMQDFDITTKKGSLKIYSDLQGHAVDNNLKSWIVEYGEGDNPPEWNEYSKGESQLVGKDNDGNPIQDVSVKRFEEGEVAWLANKKFRITVEDYAGNKTSDITRFVEEKLLIHKHEWSDNAGTEHSALVILPMPENIYPDFAIRGLHALGGLETIRLPIVSMHVQHYSDDRVWIDDLNVVNSLSGVLSLGWDTSGLSQKYAAVRVKAVDTLGQEYYSNIMLTGSLFYLNVCDMSANNTLFEELKLLKLQIQSSQDARYAQWTDFNVFDAGKGDAVPLGAFSIPPFPGFQKEVTYTIRMLGVGISGKAYESTAQYPGTCNEAPATRGFLLKITPAEATCGTAADETALSVELTGLYDASLTTLSYYIQKTEGLQLLRQFDDPMEGSRGVTIDTSGIPEGKYPVKAVLSSLDLKDNAATEISASNTLNVDRVLPTAQITYPTKASMPCSLKTSDSKEDWYRIPIGGIVTDNNKVKKYEIYYGVGESPSTWLPAMTRVNGKLMPITGSGNVQGLLGDWDVTDLFGTSYSLRLKVVDVVGNVSCYTTSFSIKPKIEIPNLTVDKKLFSPNNDGDLDNVTVHFVIDEYADVDVKVFKLLASTFGSVLDTTPVRTLRSGTQHAGGTGNVLWDGKDDANIVLHDGFYGIVVFATDQCGNDTVQKWVAVEVDSTKPSAVIAYPQPNDALGNIIEVKGTAEDLHFKSSTLEAGQGEHPAAWTTVAATNTAVKDNILGRWNTFGLDGRWTLRLTATDTVGNKNSSMVTIDLGLRKTLIQDLDAEPKLFSPNNDGKLDTTVIQYELTDACQVRIDILDFTGNIKTTYTTGTPSLGSYTYTWDGKDGTGLVVADGAYTVNLNAVLTSNPSVAQDEIITVVVDSTAPTININQPLNNSYSAAAGLNVFGTISDLNLTTCSITNTGDSGTNTLDLANQSRENYTFSILNDLAEGTYALHVLANDLGENETNKNIIFTIDRTPPAVKLDTPKNGAYLGTISSAASGTAISSQSTASIAIIGSMVEKNLDVFNLRYGLGDAPAQWTDLVTGTTVTAYPSSYAWKAGKDDGVPDGAYTLSLFARDKAGLTGEAKVKVIVDNIPPTVAIISPSEGGYVKTAVDVKGTAFDQNLDKYTVEVSEGRCASAFKWAGIKSASASVQDGALANWQALPPDGDYCMKITAIDKVGSSSEAKVNVKVDTTPPAAPVLAYTVEDKTTAQLTWTGNAESDLAGYNVYRGGQKVNAELVPGSELRDENLGEGVYAYTVKVVDFAGWESVASNEVKIKIDLTGPSARIKSPRDGARVSGLIDIKGMVFSEDDFKQYRVSIGQGANPSAWTLIRTSPMPISYGVLAPWDTLGLAEGMVYSITLEAEDTSGNITIHQIQITVDNTAPAKPVLVSAAATNADTTATWNANTETDLAGYLLYRNDQLANVSGIVIGDLKPYLISTTAYIDKTLPDGTYTYSVVAMDSAGNMSDPSDMREVTIDTHPPHAAVVDPTNTSKFDEKIMVKAESADLDISAVQFQYQSILSSPTTTTDWLNLGTPATTAPYISHMDPSSLGLVFGDYRLRAVAADKGNKTDPSPGFITVTYTDVTPPAAPQGIKAKTNGATVTITWNAPSESDLAGYNIYRTSGSTGTKVNAALVPAVPQHAYEDAGLLDGSYLYDITAVDTHQNESNPSYAASAKVYAPVITQLGTPTAQQTIQVFGSNSAANSTVDIFVENNAGYGQRGSVVADQAGAFSFEAVLTPGENRITVRVTDFSGNVSRTSDAAVVVYDERPVPPTGLEAFVAGSKVSLTWNENAETDLAGYHVYRNAGQEWVRITSTALQSLSYQDVNLPNGAYSYYVTAKDQIGGESQPSNTVVARLALDPPQDPFLLNVIALPTGELSILWEDPGTGVASHTIYRSTTSGGPYAMVNGAPVPKTSYIDAGLVNGRSYFYVITASDQAGNESGYSNEALGIPTDTLAPLKPVTTRPTTAERTVTIFKADTEIAGFAEAGSTVEVFTTGASVGNAPAVKKDVIQSVAIGTVAEPAISPDGKSLAYTYNYNSVLLIDLRSGETMTIIHSGWKPVWSGDGNKIAYTFWDAASATRLGLYDVVNNTTMSLTNDSSVVESGPSMPMDGNRIAYRSTKGGMGDNLWLKDLASGSTIMVTNGDYLYAYMLSPDGMKLAYIAYSYSTDEINLYLYDVASATTSLIESMPQPYYLDWSHDSTKIAFVSSRTGYYKIHVFDVTTAAMQQVTETASAEYNPHWSPDGRYIVFVKNGNELWVASYPSGEIRQVMKGYYVQYLSWIKSGDITFVYGSDLYKLALDRGYFILNNVALDPGVNTFTAVAKDDSGNTSEASESITVIYDTSMTPDMSISSDDIYIYPLLPIAGDQLTVNIAVRNNSQVELKDIDVDVYMWNAKGEMELLTSERIPSLASESAGLVSAFWESHGNAGENRLVVVVDPNDAMVEIDESNNMAIKDFYVVEKVGVSMSTGLDAVQYSSSRNANIAVTIRNSGPATNAVLDVRIEDENGYPVSLFDAETLNLAYATETTRNLPWNTGSTYAGPYVVHATLKDASAAILAENTTAFTIVSDAAADLTIVTDKAAYGPRENIVTGFTIRNTGTNSLIPALQATVSISDANGAVLFTDVKTAANLLPGSSVDLSSLWNTGLTTPGRYVATVAVSSDSLQSMTKSAAFSINTMQLLTGTITASPSIVSAGNAAQVSYTLANAGNADARGVTARITIIDPETQLVMQVSEATMDLPANTNRSGQTAVNTSGYGLKTYTAALQTLSQGAAKNLANTPFTVKDLTPPVLTIVSPASNGTYSATVSISVLASDKASGVDQVEYRVDSGGWKLLPVADPAQGRYAATWDPVPADNGSHVISFEAKDKAGNMSVPVPANIVIQIRTDTTPPGGSMSINNGATFTNNALVTLNLGCTDTESGCSRMQFSSDDAAWSAPEAYAAAKAWTLSAGDGQKTVYVMYTDGAGNPSGAISASITLDTTPPELTIDPVQTPANISQQVVAGTRELNSSVTVTCLTAVVGLPGYPTDTTWSVIIADMTEGTNLITVSAMDRNGNVSNPASTTITLDSHAPDTIIQNGPAPLTNRAAASFSFIASEESSTFECSMDQGSFAACTTPVDYQNIAEGAHTFQVRANDQAGNTDQTPAVYIWTVDTVPPVAVIGGIPSNPTNMTSTSLQVSGTDVQSYRYQVDTGTQSAETTLTTPIVLTELIDGDHTVFVIGKDSAGNWQRPEFATTAVWTVDTQAPVLSLSTLHDNALTNNDILNIAGTATDTIGIQSVLISGVTVTVNKDGTFSQALKLITGSNTITTIATDLAGNTTTDTRTIILDQTAPMIAITEPSDNSVTNIVEIIAAGSVDKTAAVTVKLNNENPVAATMNGNDFSLLVILDYGRNTIEVTAVDLAGNIGTAKRTVTFDNVSPSLAVTNPGLDIMTSQASLLLQGTVEDLTITNVAITHDGSAYTPAVVNGSFEQQLTFTDEQIYSVLVTATDAAGNSTTVQRNIIYDKTPPILTIDTIKTPTNNSQQTVTGTMEMSSIVTITCLTATVGPVSYPTSTTWSAIIAGMTEATNLITVSSTDGTGNVSEPVNATVVLDTHAPVTTVSPAAGTYNTSIAVLLSANEAAKIYFTTDGTAPTTASPSYGSPIVIDASKTIQFYSMDTAGNREMVKSAAYIINTGPPSYGFYGFFSPVDNPPHLNMVNAGQAIPVKWRLIDGSGMPVPDPVSFKSLKSYLVMCDGFSGDPTDAIEEHAAGSSGLRYLGDGNWQFNWKTPKTYARQCRMMVLTLGDNSTHTARFKFNTYDGSTYFFRGSEHR